MVDGTQQMGKYRILDELGRGGFATVYRAFDTTLDREVALKVLHPQLLTDPHFIARFQREARAMARLDHRHIVTVYEVSEVDGRLLIAMTLADGGSLADRIAAQGSIPWAEVLALLEPVCAALDYAHERGVVHRDLKPSNVLLDGEKGLLLSDFGFARLMGESSVSVSLSGGILGTPAYIAPEVWELDAAAVPADVYALGCILYEMLTGQVLFGGKTPMQVMRAHDQGPRWPAEWPAGVPAEIVPVLEKALAREPGARYPSAGSFWQALREVEAAAQAAREAAERAAVAAQWKAEAGEAMAAEEWSTARMAVGRWLAITPEDEEARAAMARIKAQLQPRPPEPPPEPVVQTGPPHDVPPVQGVKTTSPPPGDVGPPRREKSRRVPIWVWGLGGLFLLAALLCGAIVIGQTLLGSLSPSSSGTSISSDSEPTRTLVPAPTFTPSPTPTPTPTPIPPPLTGRIVFVSDRDNGEDIYVVDVDGYQQPIRISNSGLDYAPYWSRSTGNIIFASKRGGKVDIYSMNASGGEVEQLTDGGPWLNNPVLAPTGDKIAFIDDGIVAWMSLESREVHYTGLGWQRGFAWSLDGRQIAAIDYLYPSSGEPGRVVVQVVDTDNPDTTPVTILEHDGTSASDSLAWSPDGETLAFPLVPDESDPELGIYVVGVDGAGLRELADVPDANDTDPVWSPDGSSLLFVSISDTRGDSYSPEATITACDNSVIYRVEADGSGLVQLTDSSVESYAPAWSPDGSRIAYVVLENDSNEIYVMDADGGNKRRITDPSAEADEYHPSWSPDGTQILFASSRYAPRIYILDPATGMVRLVASDSPLVVHEQPRLTADGSHLAFTREFSFSSKQKWMMGGNSAICSSEEIVVISDLDSSIGDEVEDTSFPLTRRLRNWSEDGLLLLYQVWGGEDIRIWDMQANTYRSLETVPGYASYYTSLSPDGERLAYYDYEDDQIYLVSVADGEIAGLLDDQVAMAYGGVFFSPDGTRLLFSVEDGLQVRDLEGTLVTYIHLDRNTSDYSWFPDSNHVVYEMWNDELEENGLWVYDLEEDTVGFIATGLYARNLSTSPDGRWILFESGDEGNREVYAVPAAGGAVVNLTRNPADDEDPVWIP